MNKTRLAVPALVVLAALATPPALLLGSQPAVAAGDRTADQPREGVLVTGTGEVFGTPDTLAANFAVETSAATVADALDRANTAATRMRDALVRAGVAKADLQTSDFGINARRDDAQKITGYTVNQGLTAKIRKIPQAGPVISAAVAAGGDAARLNGVSFAIENDAALLAQAREKAFADARGKAELYARAAGRPLGHVVKITEGTPSYEYTGGQDRFASFAPGAAAPVEPGQQQLSVTVTVEWAFG
ncbi:putative conserved lipoprotein LpqG [Actinoplanes ianthinogenes]|uniref:Conserved lipoprotein LpqG n=1 Tax=Actinoplanes ianthinogenes TaxID=122358 RepID=A0ABM7M8I8_9ACTN|nr:SIMPL domain-containing protein [Actinoplanes ianthinogenes]BCJ47966.1 putative conserved lipoprotein LpqG [Actinoplanes ianthinogenes]GGR05418.1 putative conserved lipoprotein LpqG [Actinoplanes ianthinogenes]